MLLPRASYILSALFLPSSCDKVAVGPTRTSTSPSSLLINPTNNDCDMSLSESDPEVFGIIESEQQRQFHGIELIASENFVSKSVLQALGSCMTNKYSEGQPGSRYYGGNEFIDQMERLCQKRAIDLFKLCPHSWSVNVQPYSGSPANFAVYTALLRPHDRIMGLDLPSGGHLTHGYQTLKRRVSATSIFFESLPYRVNKLTGLIDYEEMGHLAELFKPRLLIAGGSAYPRDWDYKTMREIADSVGAYLMADMAHISGIVAATGRCNNPFEYCDVVTSTTHKSLRGPRSGIIFCKKEYEEAINSAVFPSLQGGPHNHQIAALAVALREASTKEFQEYIDRVLSNAKIIAQELIKYGYKVVTDGTDNHIVLWDVKCTTGLTGARVEKLCELCDISVNKNSVFGDTSAINPGGIRLGTPAMTTRGVKEGDSKQIAAILHDVILLAQRIQTSLSTDETKLVAFINAAQSEKFATDVKSLRKRVQEFSIKFPLPGYGRHAVV